MAHDFIFERDFYPTPDSVIAQMLLNDSIHGKVILEPSAGKGNIVDYCLQSGAAEVLGCEINPELRSILETKCRVIGSNFFHVRAEDISHVDYIIMNPPFSKDEEHILHAFDVAPAGCNIIALCNYDSVTGRYSRHREKLTATIKNYGSIVNLENCFSDAERSTDVSIGLIRLQKPGSNYEKEFEGFFMDEDPAEAQANGLIQYNVIRDIVNRVKSAVMVYDEQLNTAVRLNDVIGTFHTEKLGFVCTKEKYQLNRNEFKKDLQKTAWLHIFKKLNMQKYATQGLREDINKFVEKQSQIPFTMRNVYQMLNIIVGTQGQRMDKALEEVFDKVTRHYDENRFGVEGWKTNSHYLLNRKFILPHVVQASYSGRGISTNYHGWAEPVEDMQKALCHLTGMDYNNATTFNEFLRQNECQFGQLYTWGFFEFRAYKKGTVHFTFNDVKLWELFNTNIARIKGYPLYESKKAA